MTPSDSTLPLRPEANWPDQPRPVLAEQADQTNLPDHHPSTPTLPQRHPMPRAVRILVLGTLVAVAIPLVPLLIFGEQFDAVIARFLDPPPAAGVVAAVEIGVLTADILLPVPSSLVTTLGGAVLGVGLGTLCGWLGMTLAALLGWGLGRLLGSRAIARLSAEEQAFVHRFRRRTADLLVILSRPIPLLAEAAAVVVGGSGMPLRRFLPAAAAGNLAVALAWSLAGSLGREQEQLQWVFVLSLLVPLAVAVAMMRRFTQETPHAAPLDRVTGTPD